MPVSKRLVCITVSPIIRDDNSRGLPLLQGFTPRLPWVAPPPLKVQNLYRVLLQSIRIAFPSCVGRASPLEVFAF